MSEETSQTPRLVGLTLLTLVAFAANSLLCRAALGEGRIDAATFTGVRLVSGAITLLLLVGVRARREGGPAQGTWRAALTLFGYAVLFSWAYVRIPAGIGALVLFAFVQLTMIVQALREGAGPKGLEWAGIALALGGLLLLTVPGADAPDAVGVALMALSGVAWGVYSLFGRGATRPAVATMGNFVRTAPLAILLVGVYALVDTVSADTTGVILAVASGSLASGIGYVLWYSVLPWLGATRASVVQLAVPVIASFGGVLLLGEDATLRLVGASAAILGGVALATVRRRGLARRRQVGAQ